MGDLLNSIGQPLFTNKTISAQNTDAARSVKAESSPETETPIPQDTLVPADTAKTKEPPAKTVPDGTVRRDSGRHDQFLLHDGFDSSRDIKSFVASEGKPFESYKFTIKMHDLQTRAPEGNMDAYLLISTGKEGKTELPDKITGKTTTPWSVAVGAYDEKNYQLFTAKGNSAGKEAIRNMKFDAKADSVSFEIDKNVLREAGWQDGGNLEFQVFTTKDFDNRVMDSLDTPEKKPWANQGTLTASVDSTAPSVIIEQPQGIDWKKEIIYSVMTDRFHDGDPSNNINVNKNDLHAWQGGDVQGLIDKLDYIKDLGVSALWISPTMMSQDHIITQEGKLDAGYHCYWPIDFYQMDPHQGTMDKFTEFIEKAHEKGLKILLDIPLNHTGFEHPYAHDDEHKDWFHHNGDVKDWNNDWEIENCSIFGLPDFNTDNPDAKKYLFDVAKFWIDKGVDGFRLDAVKSLPRAFWNEFGREMHKHAGDDFYLVGEVFDGDPDKVKNYQGLDMPGQFDYPLYFVAQRVFSGQEGMKNLAYMLDKTNKEYEHPELMSYFPDNHDVARLMTQMGNDKERVKLVEAFLFTINRIPTVYYGTETGMEGALPEKGMENNRKMMEFDKNPDMLAHFKTLTSIRNNHVALQEGNLKEMWQDDQILAYSRTHPDEEIITVLNGSKDSQTREIPVLSDSKLASGTKLKDLITGEEFSVQDGKVKVSLNGISARILAKA